MYLLVDNYDSFTWNVYHSITRLGAKVIVKRNDKINITKKSKMFLKALYFLLVLDIQKTLFLCLK